MTTITLQIEEIIGAIVALTTILVLLVKFIQYNNRIKNEINVSQTKNKAWVKDVEEIKSRYNGQQIEIAKLNQANVKMNAEISQIKTNNLKVEAMVMNLKDEMFKQFRAMTEKQNDGHEIVINAIHNVETRLLKEINKK